MAGYTHICSECGAQLPVGEEHLGRRLRCARCNTEFSARPPDGNPSSPPDDDAPPPTDALTLPCLACGTMLRIRQELLGRKLRCPQCGHEFIPEASETATSSDTAASEGRISDPDNTPPPDPPLESPAEPESRPAPGEPSAAPETDPAPPEPAKNETTPEPVSEGPSPSTSPVPRSYTHVCEACEATLQVHERYYGKTLRCTTCRAEFEADPHGPSAAADGSTAAGGIGGEGFADAPCRFRFRRWMGVAALLLVVIAAVLWWLGGNRQSGFGNEAFRVKKSRTDLGVLRNGGEAAVTVALDRETVDELIGALKVNDVTAVRQLLDSSRCIQLPAGTRVRVLERRKRSAATRVRVLDGPWSSRIVWVPVQWIE